jgi:fimbrial chaperone protein
MTLDRLRIMRHLLGAALACVITLPHAAAGDVGIMPVAVQLDRLRDRATVHVTNHGSEPMTMQADAVAWTRHDGADQHAPTGEIIVNPPVFTVPPGRTQVVRLGLRRSPDADQLATYRLVLREVPAAPADSRTLMRGAVRVLVALRVPVYVMPRLVQRAEHWQLQRDALGQLHAAVTNAGNVHLRVDAVRLHDGSPLPLAETTAGTVLLPGESRSFALRAPAPSTGSPLRLEVHTDRGPQHVDVQVAAR